LLQYAAPVIVKYQQTDNITSTALFYVVKFLKRLVIFGDDFDNLYTKLCSPLVTSCQSFNSLSVL